MSKFNKQVFFSAIVVVLLAIAACFRFFGEIILHPEEYLFGSSGDGLKNYFSVAYQVIHGDGLWFNGMLYPYGDHLIFADGQPLLTKILQFLIDADVNNGPKIIGIMNLLMIGSLVITAWCIHRLLVWNFVNPWFAIPFSVAIAFLSPQIGRFTGHYALGYTFFVPMSWMLILSVYRSSWPLACGLGASTLTFFFGLIHPYYLFIFVVFLGSILSWEVIVERFHLTKVNRLLPKVFMLIVPLFAFLIYKKWVDPYTDRPTTPGGIYGFMSTFHSVFLPTAQPLQGLFIKYFGGFYRPSSWEGNGFVGLVATFLAIGSLSQFYNNLKQRRWRVITHPVLPSTLRTVFVPSVIVLLFSMGLFHKLGLYWLGDFIQPLKQFRSLGRLVWVFYYVFSIWAVFRLYTIYRLLVRLDGRRFRKHAHALVALSIFVWSFDATVNTNQSRSAMTNKSAMQIFSDKCASTWRSVGVEINEHQAILPLPLTLIGSEKIGLEKGHRSLPLALKASVSTGLPIIGGAMSRTSLKVTEKTAQLVADSLFPRSIIEDFKSDKNLLILHSKEPLNTEEERLVKLGQLVFSNSDYKLYSISITKVKQAYIELQAISDSINLKQSDYMIPLEYEEISDSLWGAPAYKMNNGDIIFDSTFTTNDTLVISYWLKVDPEGDLVPCRVYSVNRSWVLAGGLGWNPNILGGWLYISEQLVTQARKQHRYIIDARPGVVSRIQLRDGAETLIHQDENGKTFLNNIPIR